MDESLLEGGFQGDDDALYVNFSDEEAASESRDREPLPTGKYLMCIADVELRESKSEKNKDKPYYAVQFKVVEDKKGGQFKDRSAFTNAMLFAPALFTITHIMKATGFNVAAGRVRIPTPADLQGKVLVVGGQLRPEQKDKNDPSKVYAPRFEPTFFAKPETWNAAGGSATAKTSAGGASSSLLS